MIRPDDSRARFYRLYFALAAACNVGFAAWVVVWPQTLFEQFLIDAPRDAAIWRCLGMAGGVYAMGYAGAAWRLEGATPVIALGLLGKTLAPIGWLVAVSAGWWPIRTFTLILFLDLVWWLPFGLFLIEGTRAGTRLRASAPYLCAALNLLAALAMPLLLRPGLEMTRERTARLGYIAEHPVLWRAGWGIWILAALSLLGFYSWWAARLRSRLLGMAAVALAVAGMCGDLLAETLYISWLPAEHERIEILARLLTGAWGNTLYTLSGILLTLGSAWIRGPARACAWLIWASGIALSWFSMTGNTTGMAASMALLFTLFCPWTAWVGLLDRRRIQ